MACKCILNKIRLKPQCIIYYSKLRGRLVLKFNRVGKMLIKSNLSKLASNQSIKNPAHTSELVRMVGLLSLTKTIINEIKSSSLFSILQQASNKSSTYN